jgi:trk system potassium uptake protein TrkA
MIGAFCARPRYAPRMLDVAQGDGKHAVVVGCGRVGSAVALRLREGGWEVAVIDERSEAFSRLGDGFAGITVEGHALDIATLVAAGIERAEAVVVATNGDNTNVVCAQIAQKRYGVSCVVVRVLDPARAALYAELGMRTVCPTSGAIDVLSETVLSHAAAI